MKWLVIGAVSLVGLMFATLIAMGALPFLIVSMATH